MTQGEVQASVRAVTGTTNDWNGDWSALFDLAGIPQGDWNGRMLRWLNLKMGASYDNLPEAQQRFALSLGAYNWSSIGTFNAAISGGFYNIAMPTGATSTAPDGSTNTDPVAAGWLSQTSTNIRWFRDSTGLYSSYGAGVLARNDVGIWTRAQRRSNGIRNNSMNGGVSGSPGTLPTGTNPIAWTELNAVATGITKTLTFGTDAATGLPCVDIAFTGTASSTATYELQFHGSAAMMGCNELQAAVVSAGGSGYVVGEQITLASTGGTSQKASILTVTTIGGGGAVTGVTIFEPGWFTVSPTSNPMAQASSSGAGTGATFTVTYGKAYAIGSAWMKLVSGSLFRNNNACLQGSYTTTGAANAGVKYTSDRLLNRETSLVRKKVQMFPTVANAANTRLEFKFTFTNGENYTTSAPVIRIVCPQLERIGSFYDDASEPIMTTNATVTYDADVTSLLAGPLGYVTGGTCTLELSTKHLRGSMVDFLASKPLLTANGSTNILYQDTNGQIASNILSGVTTYRAWRSQYAWDQTHAIQWGSGTARVASTASAQAPAAVSGSLPSITSLNITADGCITRLKVYQTQIDLSSYKTVSKDVIVYGATSGGVITAAEQIALGNTAAIIMRFREVQPGGMSAGGLSRIDASSLTNFGGMAIDMLYYANELMGASGSPTGTGDPEQFYTLKYFDYLIRTYQIPIYPTRPAASTPGGISSVTKNGSTKRITSFTTADGKTVSGTYFVDASYEGDLMAGAGCTYVVGREAQDTTTDANGQQKNSFNGNRGHQPGTSSSGGVDQHQFLPFTAGFANILEVYPWNGLPNTTRLPYVQADNTTSTGAVDLGSCMAYNFRQWLTPSTGTRFTAFPAGAPSGYNVANYELSARYIKALTDAGKTAVSYLTGLGAGTFSLASFFTFNGVNGNTVYDFNNLQGFSSDAIGSNWGADFQAITGSAAQQYADANNAERATYWTWLKNYTLGYWYWLQIDAPLEQAATAVVINGGSAGFAVNDYVSCVMPNQIYPLVVRVKTVSAGAITSVQVLSGSITVGQSTPADPVLQTSTTGAGTGASFNVTWGSRVPAQITSDALLFGVTNDTWQTTYCEEDFAGWMPEFYCREARRLAGVYSMNSSDVETTIGATPLQGTNTAAAGSYPIDSHHARRMAWTSSGVEKTLNEGNISITRAGFNNYFLIPVEALIPVAGDCTNLMVGFSASTKHPAFGGFRMEMAIMAVGQFQAILLNQLLANGSPDVQNFSPYYSAARTAGLALPVPLVLPQAN